MLGRAALTGARLPRVVVAAQPTWDYSQQRSMASLKDLKLRMTSIESIKKITASMKLVATSKLNGARADMAKAKAFWAASNLAFADGRGAEEMNAEKFHDVTEKEKNQDDLYVLLTSERGLCGSINSSLVRLCKNVWANNPNFQVIVAGEKGKASLQTHYGPNMLVAVTEMGNKGKFSFADMEPLVDRIAATEFREARFVANQFNSVISIEPRVRTLKSKNYIVEEADFYGFEMDDADKDELLANLYEHYVGCNIYSSMVENSAAELSARMTSMDNATKNAGDMLDRLNLQYNRQRQAGITTELSEIISGAEAVKDVE